MTKTGQPALATLRAKRMKRTELEELEFRYGGLVKKPWQRRTEDDAPYMPPGSGRPVRMPEQPPKGAPFAEVKTVFLSRHLAWSTSLAIKRHFLEREHHAGFGRPLWEMFGPDEMRALGDEEPRVYHLEASRLYLLASSGEVPKLRDVVFDWMRRVGEDVASPLRWAAFIHRKPYLHVHVLIRGLDEQDGVLYFPGSYIDHGLRWQLQHALKEALGG